MTITPIPILLYHSVSDQPAPAIGPYSVTRSTFERQLDLLLDSGRQVVTVSDLVDRVSSHQPSPRALAAITFDDGFKDTLDVAAPMLKERGLTATAYLTTGYLAREPGGPSVSPPGQMLAWSQVRELEMAGLEVAAHTHTHPHLDILPPAQAGEEVRRSKDLLEGELGHRVRSFAYPHGYASSFLRREVRAAGFDSACGVANRLSHPGDDRWYLARLTVRVDTPLATFAQWLRGAGAPLARPGETVRMRGWRQVRRLRHLTSALAGRA
jgi:peptidoglycan/xylan/chitin deacetylase (PgdA/CDA1 family)